MSRDLTLSQALESQTSPACAQVVPGVACVVQIKRLSSSEILHQSALGKSMLKGPSLQTQDISGHTTDIMAQKSVRSGKTAMRKERRKRRLSSNWSDTEEGRRLSAKARRDLNITKHPMFEGPQPTLHTQPSIPSPSTQAPLSDQPSSIENLTDDAKDRSRPHPSPDKAIRSSGERKKYISKQSEYENPLPEDQCNKSTIPSTPDPSQVREHKSPMAEATCHKSVIPSVPNTSSSQHMSMSNPSANETRGSTKKGKGWPRDRARLLSALEWTESESEDSNPVFSSLEDRQRHS